MGTTNPNAAAASASEQSGIPTSVLLPLIIHEGPSQSAPFNPFDITEEWAALAGLAGYVSGLWNSVGVAIFGGTNGDQPAIQAWAYGILHFSNYSGVRSTLANPNATVHDFYDALAKTGYSGGDPTGYTNALDALYKQTTGGDPTRELLKDAGTVVTPPINPAPSPAPLPAQPPTTAPGQPLPTGTGVDPCANLTPSGVPVFGGAIDTANQTFCRVNQTIVATVLSIERFFWIGVGVGVAALGVWVLVQAERK